MWYVKSCHSSPFTQGSKPDLFLVLLSCLVLFLVMFLNLSFFVSIRVCSAAIALVLSCLGILHHLEVCLKLLESLVLIKTVCIDVVALGLNLCIHIKLVFKIVHSCIKKKVLYLVD